METLKLLLLSFEFPPYPLAGTGQYAVNFIKSIKNHEVTVITANHGYSELEKEFDVRKVDIGLKQSKVNRSFIDRKSLFALKSRRYLRSIDLSDYDLMHSLTLRDSAFLEYGFLRRHLPVVVSVNDYYIIGASLNPLKFHFKSMDFPIRYVHHNIMKQFYIRSLKNCDRIIANAGFTKDKIISCGISGSKIDVVLRGIDTKRFDVPPAKGKYSSHNVLFVGPNMERKGAMYLIKAAPEIARRFPDATFTVIGDGPKMYMKRIERFLQENKIREKFQFIPHVRQEELLPYYSKANVFVMPSIIEALGQVYMEAMMTQTPAIGAAVGGVPEILVPGTGFLVKPQCPEDIAESVSRIFSDSKMAEKVGKAGKKRIETHFFLERMTAETLDIYRKVLNR